MRAIMTIFILALIAMTASTSIAQVGILSADSMLTPDQVAQLRIQRQMDIDQRQVDIEQLIACRMQLKTLMDYWNGKNPTVANEAAKLSAAHVAIAAATGAVPTVALHFLGTLPEKLFWRMLVKYSPAAIGVGVAAYFYHADYAKYRDPIQQVLDSKHKRKLYVEIQQKQLMLIADQERLSNKIINLDDELRPYDAFDKFQKKHYSALTQYSLLK